jgi:UDP-glucose 4-epimerase
MKALVTGAAGFIGSNLVDRLLAEGHQVEAVDDLSAGTLANLAEARRSPNGRLTFHQLDIRSPALGDVMRRSRPDVVYHLAAPKAGTPALEEADRHVMGSLRVLEGARASGVQKVVFTSGAAIYGDPDPGDLPLRESHPQKPVALDGVAKKAVGDYLFAYREMHSLEFTALVLGHVYGPRQSDAGPGGSGAAGAAGAAGGSGAAVRAGGSAGAGGSVGAGGSGAGSGAAVGPVGPVGPVVASFAARLARAEPGVIHGTGGATRDFVYVDDVVDALARAAERGGGLLINVGTGRETAIRDLYRAMAGQAGLDAPPARAPERAGEVRRISLDPGRASIHLGWKPWTSLAEGTAALLEWRGARGG